VDGPVLLCGLGTVGWRVLELLRTAGVPVVVVDRTSDPEDPRLFGVRCVKGDFREKGVLAEAGVRDAGGVLVVTSDDLVNISAALMVRSLNPDVRIVLRMFNQNLVSRLSKAVRNVAALSVSALSAPMLALSALTGGVLAAFPQADGRRQIADMTVTTGSKLAGRRVADVGEYQRFVVLAHAPVAHQPRLLLDLDPAAVLEPGDRVVVCGEPEDVQRLLEPGGDALEVLWAGKLRRYGRLVRRTLGEIDLAVKVCTVALFTVVTFSACVYRYGLGDSWPDAFYHTVSVIATGGDMGGQTYEGWGKVFVSFLRLAGTALVAAFTAIVTNSLLTARLGGAFEVRRIPDRGHVVVCGLGNVGFRVAEELIRMDERVVVVERKSDNPFIASCRRQGVAVVAGDATVPEVLRQARVDTARAVIAATSADLVNLEIALLVAEIEPLQRVVVRIGDDVLAETVRQAANVRLALSVAELAAPAFVAGLFGDRVLAVFQVGGRLLAVLELVVATDDTRLVGQSLRVLAVDQDCMPVAIVGEDGSPRPPEAGYRLRPGDHLTLVATLDRLDRLTRREPVPAEWSVEVTAFPLPMRDDLAVRLRTLRHLDAEAAERIVNATPFVLAEHLTLGQARELLGLMERERIAARIVK
jgi:Trk K+ transport system NAD-binding subunit